MVITWPTLLIIPIDLFIFHWDNQCVLSNTNTHQWWFPRISDWCITSFTGGSTSLKGATDSNPQGIKGFWGNILSTKTLCVLEQVSIFCMENHLFPNTSCSLTAASPQSIYMHTFLHHRLNRSISTSYEHQVGTSLTLKWRLPMLDCWLEKVAK